MNVRVEMIEEKDGWVVVVFEGSFGNGKILLTEYFDEYYDALKQYTAYGDYVW